MYARLRVSYSENFAARILRVRSRTLVFNELRDSFFTPKHYRIYTATALTERIYKNLFTLDHRIMGLVQLINSHAKETTPLCMVDQNNNVSLQQILIKMYKLLFVVIISLHRLHHRDSQVDVQRESEQGSIRKESICNEPTVVVTVVKGPQIAQDIKEVR